jgi:hypothetical protein
MNETTYKISCIILLRLWKSTETDDEWTDFKFVLDDASTYRVHRSILCARSEYFRQKFQDEWQNRRSIVVRMVNTSLVFNFDASRDLRSLFTF